MDRRIETPKWTLKKVALLMLISVSAACLILMVLTGSSGARLHIGAEKLVMDTVRTETFREFIPVTGTVHPIKTVFLDVPEGGRVEEKLMEEGSMVKKGEPVIRLSNSTLQLEYMNKEASFLDQMNNMRNTLIALEQNHLQLKQQLLDIEHSFAEKKRLYDRSTDLYREKVIAAADFEKAEDDYRYISSKRKLLIETIRKDSVFKSMQVKQLESNTHLIQRNLGMIKQSLDNLVIKAPISGQLTALSAEIGENKSRGTSVGQIDVMEGFKVKANIDEHYLSRIVPGLKGEFDFGGRTYMLEIKKVLPQVSNGQFQADMVFTGEVPEGIRQGQSLQVRLAMGEQSDALLIRRGGFYQHTGGNWIFVLSGNKAVKRPLRIGRQNPDHYEVLNGLRKGEVVIVSGYEMLNDSEELIINEK
jgi:HlyD family secretion protein